MNSNARRLPGNQDAGTGARLQDRPRFMRQRRALGPVAANAAAADVSKEIGEVAWVRHGASVSNFSDLAKPNLGGVPYG